MNNYNCLTMMALGRRCADYRELTSLINKFEEYEETKLCRYDWTEKGTDAPCKSEICKFFAYDTQTYILNWDGSMYNEICEFTFDDKKTGHGYYYQANRDAAE